MKMESVNYDRIRICWLLIIKLSIYLEQKCNIT